MRGFLRFIAYKLRPWVAELVIHGVLPERIGRYRILDILISAEDNREQHD
jgi:hypothetical protein